MRRILLVIGLLGCVLTNIQAQNWVKKLHQLRQRWDVEAFENRKMAESLLIPQMNVAWEAKSLEQIPDRSIDKNSVQPVWEEKPDNGLREGEIQIQKAFDGQLERLDPKSFSSTVGSSKNPVPKLTADELSLLNQQVACGYYGKRFPIRYHTSMQIKLGYRTSKTQVSQAWSRMQRYYGEKVLFQLMTQAHEMELNDWGFFLLVNKAAKRIFPNDVNAQTVFNVFCITKAGYIGKLGEHRGKLYLMTPARQVMYGATYLKGRDYKYYVLDLNGKKVNLQKANVLQIRYPEADQILDMNLSRTPKLPPTILTRKLTFSYANEEYQVNVKLNKNVAHFYYYYPFTDWNIQMATPPSRYVRQSLLPPLKEMIRGKSEKEAANLLLRFVQTALPYKTDHQQFGDENYLFIEEVFYYPYSDCEDRSVLFAYLVRELLNLEVIGLMFPGHAATAVKFTQTVTGSYIIHKGKRFTVCDPTYINAGVGLTLPELTKSNVTVVSMN